MKESKKIYSATITLILIFELVFLYYIKYSNQGLTLADFSLNNTGNILNLSITLALILGIFLYMLRNETKLRLINGILIISLVLIIISFLFTLIDFPPDNIYLFGLKGDKLIDAAFLTLYYLSVFILLSAVWLKVFGYEKKVFVRSLFNSIIIIFIYLGLTYIFIHVKGYDSGSWKLTSSRKNIAVVLGAAVWSGNQPSPSLSGRIDRAVDLYKKGIVGEILLTGGNAPGEMTEAEVAYEYAKRKGMDMSKVNFETLTTSTSEQLKYIKNMLVPDKDYNDIILVSDSYHLIRVIEISKFFNTDIKVAASRLLLKDESRFLRQFRECIALTIFWSFAL